MSRRRFYASPGDITASSVSLSADETHHLIRVVRSKPGDEVFIFDGCGSEYRCTLVAERTGRAELKLIEPLDNNVESPLDLTLGQAIAKGEKFDFIVQKATELGVKRIIPLVTTHADVKLDPGQPANRLERWKRISLEAIKQCGRRRLVDLSAPMTISGLFENVGPADKCLFLVFSEKGGSSISEALRDLSVVPPITILIGPEGGWSDDELRLIGEHGAAAVTLGPRILRTETAAIVAITLLQNSLGDLSAQSSSRRNPEES